MKATLFDFVVSCYLFDATTNYNKSLREFKKKVTSKNGFYMPDYGKPEHREALFSWLRKWKCRQFALEYRDVANDELVQWLNKTDIKKYLCGNNILSLDEKDYFGVSNNYESLMDRTACYRKGRRSRFGPAGASKILYSLYPESIVAWDIDIRKKFGFSESGDGFVKFLKKARGLLEELRERCEKQGFKLEELPGKIRSEKTTLVELANEYIMVSYSLKYQIPTKDEIIEWVRW